MGSHRPHRAPWRVWTGWLAYLGLLTAVISIPFLLRPHAFQSFLKADRHLVVMTPHDQWVRAEIGQAFGAYWKEMTGETLEIDWRIPGGSSEMMLFIRSEFAAAARATPLSENPEAPPGAQVGNSKTGIGVDVIFGGGAADFQQYAGKGYLDPGKEGTEFGIRALRRRHPDWFEENVLPEIYRGERFRDASDRWIGVVLANFGILYNRDLYKELGSLKEPTQWSDLARPELSGHVALADPSKSGSVAKAFELMIQLKMFEEFERLKATGDPDAETRAVRMGWRSGFQLIQRLAANARYFSDSAGKIGLEIARGDAAAGMAIDVYGRTLREYVRDRQGVSRIGFVVPTPAPAPSVDPVGLLKGAQNPDVATSFIEFLLSSRGQRLWALKPGEPGGPVAHELHRLPIRRDVYGGDQAPIAVAENQPYASAEEFEYHPNWTQGLFPVIRFLVRVAFVEPHRELTSAWQSIIQAGMDPSALAIFEDLEDLDLERVREEVLPVLERHDKPAEMRLARQFGSRCRARYLEAINRATAVTLP